MTPAVRPRCLALASAAVLLLGGCGASPSTGPEVLAAEDVFAAPPVVVADESGTSASLQVSTELDMACAVVFGTDESLGDGIATDTDMGGGAHTDHQAVTVTVDDDRTYGPFAAGTTVSDGASFTGQVLRIDADRTTGGNTGAAEVEVYEAP